MVHALDSNSFFQAIAQQAVVQAVSGRADSLDDAPTLPATAPQRAARGVERVMAAAMVPLLMATLALVIASQIAEVGSEFGRLARLVPIYAVFVPLALALPEGLEIAALAVVTQTMVELVAMVILVKLVPRLIGERATAD